MDYGWGRDVMHMHAHAHISLVVSSVEDGKTLALDEAGNQGELNGPCGALRARFSFFL